MIKQLEQTISAFTHLAVACTFGLAVSIGVAGLSKTRAGCSACVPTFAAVTITQQL